jgi:hydroxyacylglutathione hydrolase
MIIQQFYDKGLAHASYAIIRGGKMVMIDPSRDPQPYYDFAALHGADITGVIETHPHADFVSSHLEIHRQTGAVIYVSKLTGAEYPHESFDDGDTIQLTDIKLKAINTPGHSPDSICILLEDESGHDVAIFTCDTLFVGDVVYPAHGPGSLCGKNMSPDLQSTIGRELRENYALQLMDELQFVKTLTTEQPFVPKYFGYDVDLNKTGAPNLTDSIGKVLKSGHTPLEKGVLIIDARPKSDFRSGHIKGAMNLQDGEKFETWLGSIAGPGEQFYLIADSDKGLDVLIRKTAKIGYEKNIKAAMLTPGNAIEKSAELDLADFNLKPSHYTIIDVRNWGEINEGRLFSSSIPIPLPELRERLDEIPTGKPIVVHCAGGYRSAAAASIIAGKISSVPVYDLGEAILEVESLRSKV